MKEYTLGASAVWKPNDDWKIDAEIAKQFGDRSTDDIDALALHTGVAYRLMPDKKMWVYGEYNVGSGDKNSADNTLGTFDRHNNFPTNHTKYGYAYLFSWKNMQDIRVGVKFEPWKKTFLSLDYHLLSINELSDAWYRASGAVLNGFVGGTFPTEAKMADEIDVLFKYKYNKQPDFLGGYSLFMMDQPVPATGRKDKAQFLYAQTRFSF